MGPTPLRAAFREILHYSPTPHELKLFSPFQVELLLNQSADLLDRAQKRQSEYEALRARAEEQRISQARFGSEIELIKKHLIEPPIHINVNWAGTSYSKDMHPYTARAKAFQCQMDGLHNSQNDYIAAKDDPAGGQKNRSEAHAAWVRALFEHLAANALQVAEEYEAKVFNDRFSAENDRYDQIETARDGGGALDFAAQGKRLLPLLERDRNDAYVRLKQASGGLAHVYSDAYQKWADEQKLPGNGDLPGDAGELEALVQWTENAIAFIAGFSQREHGFSVCISLRDAMGESDWANWKKDGFVTTRFLVGPSLVETHRYVRLRGIAAVLISQTQELYPWRLLVAPPKRQYRQTEAGLAAATYVENSNACRVIIGRVETQGSNRAPDLAGMITLYNLSPSVPAGQTNDEDCWQVSAQRYARSSVAAPDLDDIRLELALVGLPV